MKGETGVALFTTDHGRSLFASLTSHPTRKHMTNVIDLSIYRKTRKIVVISTIADKTKAIAASIERINDFMKEIGKPIK